MTYPESLAICAGTSDISLNRDVGTVAPQIVGESFLNRGISSTDRDAILRDFYEARSGLNRLKRIGQLTDADASSLADINREIDKLESLDAPPRSASPLWQEIEALAERVLELHKK
jgi:hypothetical protein